MAFSASEAAMEGFRIARREPATIAIWCVLQLILGVAVTVVTFPYMRPLMALEALSASGTTSLTPAAAMAALEPMLGLTAVMIPIELVLVSVLGAAVYRAVLRPEDKGLGRLRLGGDELRLGILWIELGLFVWAAGILALIVLVILASGLVAATKGSPANVLALVMMAYLIVAAGMAWLAVRLSLAAPMTFATRQVRLFSAWRLTKDCFWPLFGCYLLTFIFMIMIGFAQLFMGYLAALAISGGSIVQAASSYSHADYSSLQAYLTPVRVVALLINALLGGVYWSVALAPAAVAYKEMVGPGARASA